MYKTDKQLHMLKHFPAITDLLFYNVFKISSSLVLILMGDPLHFQHPLK